MSDSELTVANHGIWIPNTVWESKELSIQEKALLARIHGFKECFASNQYLADFLGLSVTRVKVIIKSLTDKGFITRTEERQGQLTVKRTLSVVKAKYYGVEGHEPENGPTPARKRAHPQPENGHHNNTELVIQNNNTDMSPDGSACSVCKGEKGRYEQMELMTNWIPCNHCQGTGKEPVKPDTPEQPTKADKPKPKRNPKWQVLKNEIQANWPLIASADDYILTEWCKLRIRKGAKGSDIAHRFIEGQITILMQYGLTVSQILENAIIKEWRGIEADWFNCVKDAKRTGIIHAQPEEHWAEALRRGDYL